MKARGLVTLMLGMAIGVANAAMTDISQLFKRITDSDYVSGKEMYVIPAKGDGVSQRMEVTEFSMPVAEMSLIKEIKRAFSSTDDAYFKVENNGTKPQYYNVEIDGGRSVNFGGKGKNLLSASFAYAGNDEYRYVYAIEWVAKDDKIEGRVISTLGKRPKGSKQVLGSTFDFDTKDLEQKLKDVERNIDQWKQGLDEDRPALPKVYVDDSGLVTMSNIDGSTLYATTGKECRVVGKGYDISVLKGGKVKINGNKYNLRGKSLTISEDGSVKDSDEVTGEYGATLSVDDELKKVRLNGMLLFSHAEGYELHDISGKMWLYSRKNLRNASIPNWMNLFDFYCRGINKNTDTDQILLAYLKRMNDLTKDMSNLNGHDREIVEKKIHDIFEKLRSKDDLSTSVISEMYKIAQNFNSASKADK